jgi:hypothetical protein
MVEVQSYQQYHRSMNALSLSHVFRQSLQDLLDSLDMRQSLQPRALRPGETVESAWTSTGSYLRKAIDGYGEEASRARAPRPTR